MSGSIRTRRAAGLGVAAMCATLVGVGSPSATLAAPPSPTAIDLSQYVRVGRFDLPEPTRTAAPAGSLLCQEASAVTYDPDTDTLFICGDGGTSIVQVTKAGALVNSMSLAPGGSPQGTDFYDTEGLTYVGSGRFVLVEERYRQVNLLTYAANTTLSRAGAQTVKLGTTLGNVGIEGITFDPLTGGFVAVKETSPQGIFQTGVDFAAGTATNGSPTTDNSTNLFDPALLGVADIADVYALSNLPSLAGLSEAGHLLVLSQESGRVVEVDRTGTVLSTLTIVADAGNPLNVAQQGFEGVTMDHAGNLYLVCESGGGDSNHPQLWVYAPGSGVNQAPTALALTEQVNSVVENSSTASRLKVASVAVIDDGLGTNAFSVSGADASSFEADSTGLYVRAGVVLDFETKSSYSVAVHVDDVSVGATPDASAAFNLTVIDVVDESSPLPRLVITEVAPWGSGASNTPYNADWFEVTNTGASTANISGWKIDDSSHTAGLGVLLTGISTIAPGESVIFMETASDATLATFRSTWFGANVPAGLKVGRYSGAGVGLSTDGDEVNLFDAGGVRVTGVRFGASTTASPFRSFDNAAGLGGTTDPVPLVSGLSSVGVGGAFNAVNDPVATRTSTGSPGRIVNRAPVAIAGPDQTVEATGPGGALVSLSGANSFDADGDVLAFTWSQGGSTVATGVAPSVQLALGVRTVTLQVTDPYGSVGSDDVQVTVRDTTAPALVGNPDGMTVDATSPDGAVVLFTAPTATDLVDGAVSVICDFPSGSVFPIGTTLNSSVATDAHENAASASFRVTVRGADDQLATLLEQATGAGPGNSLNAKLLDVQAKLARGDVRAACNLLDAFLHEVSAQSGKKLSAVQAAAFIAAADQIQAVLGH